MCMSVLKGSKLLDLGHRVEFAGHGYDPAWHRDASVPITSILADCLIDEVFKCLNGIPEDFGLLLDRQAGRIRVFQIEDTGILDILQPELGQHP